MIFSYMKSMFEELPSPSDVSNGASTSDQSRVDQEMGLSHMQNLNFFSNIPHGVELDPVRMFLGEMVGTFMLMFCVCGIIAVTQLMGCEVGLLEYAATGGLTVVVVVFSVGSISGAHVNPAVTVALAIFGHFPWTKVPYYVLAQTTGSILAALVGKLVYGIKPELMMTRPLQGCTSAFWVELIATFMITFLVASMTNQAKSVGHLSGFVVGIAIGLAVLITGPISGGSLNPARSLGPAIVSWKFDGIWIYIIAPTIGASSGALLFCFLRLRHQHCGANTNSSPDTSCLY